MYNEDRKLRFMRDSHRRSVNTANIFEIASAYETKYDTDICEFTTLMLRDLFDNNFGVTARIKNNVWQRLLYYHDWCMGQGYPTCGDIAGFEPDSKEFIRRTMVASPLHLERELDKFLRPFGDGGTDNVLRGYFELAFLDFSKEEALALTDADLHLESMTIGGDPGVLIPAEFFANLKFCAESPVVLEYRTRGEKPRTLRRPPHGQLLRTTKELGANAIHSSVQKHKDAHPESGLTYKGVRDSGMMYRKYQESLATGAPVNFTDEIRDAVRENCAGKTRTQINNYQSRLRRDYVAKYESWKQTFYNI